MGHWDDFTDNWNYYRPEQPRQVEGGLKAKSKQGAIGSTWWSRRWIRVLESLSMGTRLARGRGYARQGQVASIDIESGLISARVQGSQIKPYNVKIQLKPLTDRQWEQVADVMAGQALFAAKLLAGEMPENIEEAFQTAGISLFPTHEKDLLTTCSCPDWANPCKHIAAVYYLLAERFDEDPFLIFKLRGRDKDAITQALRARRTEARSPSTAKTTPDARVSPGSGEKQLEENAATFWRAGDGLDTFVIHPDTPRVERAVLKRLGAAPFSIYSDNLTTLLELAYAAIDADIKEK